MGAAPSCFSSSAISPCTSAISTIAPSWLSTCLLSFGASITSLRFVNISLSATFVLISPSSIFAITSAPFALSMALSTSSSSSHPARIILSFFTLVPSTFAAFNSTLPDISHTFASSSFAATSSGFANCNSLILCHITDLLMPLIYSCCATWRRKSLHSPVFALIFRL